MNLSRRSMELRARRAPTASGATSTILEKLGVFGLHDVEDAVLAGLVTGDPVLLVGSHGSAKTLLAQVVARALGLRFWAYDASKANFEDLIGFPVPDSLKEEEVRYARTALSILDKEFVLVDEISRASPSMQSKWLEIVRARKVMGLSIAGLRHVMAAMNPPGEYAGAVPLDKALAGRFAWILPVPEFSEMGVEDRRRVLDHLGPEDAPRIARDEPPAADAALPRLLEEAARRFESVRRELHDLVSDYLVRFTTALQVGRAKIDGRRASMLARNIPALVAVREVRTGRTLGRDAADVKPQFWDAVRLSMPFAATAESVSEGTIHAAHGTAVDALRSAARGRASDAALRVLAPSDPLRAAAEYAAASAEFGPPEHAAFVTRLEDAIKAKASPADLARNVAALRKTVALYQGGVPAPADVVRRALRLLRDTLAVDVPGFQEGEVAHEYLGRPADALVYRIAARAAQGDVGRARPHRHWARVRTAATSLAEAVAEVRGELARAAAFEESGRIA